MIAIINNSDGCDIMDNIQTVRQCPDGRVQIIKKGGQKQIIDTVIHHLVIFPDNAAEDPDQLPDF